MISWDTMTLSSLSSTHPGHTHITFPRCQNWTTRLLRLLLLWHPCLPVRRLLLSRAPSKSTTSPDKLFPRRLHPPKCTCLSPIVKRGTRLPSEFFGPCPDHSDTRHRQHQHHVPSHKWLRTVSPNKRDVSCWRRSRPRRLHKF